MPALWPHSGTSSRVAIPPEFRGKALLLSHLGLSEPELKKIWWFRERMYTSFNIHKKSGKARPIDAPNSRLKILQKSIAESLGKCYVPRDVVHGFVTGRSVRSNAETHLQRRHIVNVDLKSFFATITEGRVVGLLISIGIDKETSEIIARLCCKGGVLPQGSPASPILSNMVCFRMDKALLRFAKSRRLLYTRYADDITLSSFQGRSTLFDVSIPPAGRLATESLATDLLSVIRSNGFEINQEKIHYADRTSRRSVTGIKVNEGLNVDRCLIRNIRSALYKIEKLGVVAAQADLIARLGKPVSLQAHLQGKISWVGFVKGQGDPIFRSLSLRYNRSFPMHLIKVKPTATEMRERAIWVVETDDSQGTAFFLEGFGLVTAYHCISVGRKIEIFHPSRPTNKFTVTVAHSCERRDLAILTHSLSTTEYFEIKGLVNAYPVGAASAAAGYPSYGFGDQLSVRSGTISSYTVKSGIRLIEVTQKLSQGMSGGPLLNDVGHAIGIIHKGGPEEQRDFAIDLSELVKWFATL